MTGRYTQTSTTLADLFTPLLFADLSSAVRTSLKSWLNDEFDDGVAYGWHARLRRWTVAADKHIDRRAAGLDRLASESRKEVH